MRQERSLAGSWQFQLDPAGTLTVEALAPDREIPVPLPWQAAFPDLQQYSGYAWYRRTLDLDAAALDGAVLLHFGAVDYWCQVFVNGHLAGEHEGGYTPFTLSIRPYVHPGANALAVRVYDSAQSEIRIPRWPDYQPAPDQSGPPFTATDVPHGKQEWYINVGGLWQDVTCITVPAAYLSLVHVTPDIHEARAYVAIELAGAVEQAAGGTIHIAVQAGGRTIGEATLAVEPAVQTQRATIAIPQPRLWDTADPFLYTAVVRLETRAGADELRTRFGMREISTRDGKLLLNGAPIFLLCALDQDLYPDTIYTVPSEEFLRDQFQKAKHLGLNTLRCHIKPPDPRYLDLADEMGLLIWAEIPSWRTFYPKGTMYPALINLEPALARRAEQTLVEMVRRDFNHPALVIWTIVNEDWGTALPLSAHDRAWISAMYTHCKELDPTRLVVDNSPCPHAWGPNIHVHSDLDDFHMYSNIPDHARGWEHSMDQFNLRPLWSYSSNGDAVRTGREPLILSEFGNWGLPSLASLRRHYGGDPGWFHLGPWWSAWDGESGWPGGVEERFHALGLDAVWPDYEAFATATQWHQYAAMKFEIEAMRRQSNLVGYVITEFTDAYWESNGLLDFVREPKAYYDRFGTINAPDVLVPQVERYDYWDDQNVPVRLFGAHYSPADWTGAQLRWTIGEGGENGERAVAALARGEVRRLDVRFWGLPPVERPEQVRTRYTLLGADERELARNDLDLLVLPASAREPAYAARVAVVGHDFPVYLQETTPGPDVETAPALEGAPSNEGAHTPLPAETPVRSDLERTVRGLGYRTTRGLSRTTEVAVSNYPNAELLEWVRAGGKLLFLSYGPSPFFWVQGRGGAYSGGWITSYSWLRPGIYRRLDAITNPLGLPFMNVMPRATILGLPYEDRAVQGDFLAGMVSGWTSHPSVHTVQFRYGQGTVIMTTFLLEEGGARGDAVAVAMFHDLLDHLASDACQPTLTANY